MPRSSRVREPVSQIEAEIRRKVRDQAELISDTKDQAEKVRDHWRNIAPVDSGAYAASIHIEQRPPIEGLPRFAVVAGDWKAHFIEFGTGPDTKEGSPFGQDTPTPEFAPAAKTAAYFGGTAG